MKHILMSKSYWEYIDCVFEDSPILSNRNDASSHIKVSQDWNQGARKVMYWLFVSIHDSIIGNIQYFTS